MKKRIIALLMAVCLVAGGEESMAVQAEESGEGVSQEEVELTETEQEDITEEPENTGGNDVKGDIAGRPIEERVSVESTEDERDSVKHQEQVVDKLEEGVQEQSRESGKEDEIWYVESERGANLKTSADGQWEYYLEYGKATVDSYLGNATVLTIPSKIDGAAVTAISGDFKDSIGEVTSLTLPNTVNSLSGHCFSKCINLESIILSSNLTEIPTYCFYQCSNLKSIRNYGNVTEIGYHTFEECSSLPEFDFSNISEIGDSAFENCSLLSKVSLSSKLKTIPSDCFHSCSSLKNVTLKKGLTTIEDGAFGACASLEEIVFPSTLTTIYGGRFLVDCGAFHDCTRLTQVTIPANVELIGKGIFADCTSLEFVIYNSAMPIYGETFENCRSLKKVTLCDKVKNIYGHAFGNCVSLTSITIPEITEVHDWAFEGCELLSVIYGVKGSPAESFAKEHGILFKEMKKLSGVKVSKVSNKVYTGKPITPRITVRSGGKKLKAGTDYVLTYKSNKKIGRASITITGKGNYLGEKVIFFNIVPPQTTIKKLESKRKGQLTVTMSKSKGAKGYVIAYSTKKSGKYKIVYTAKTKTTLKGLVSGKKYYVKVAPYTIILARKQSPVYSKVKNKKVR